MQFTTNPASFAAQNPALFPTKAGSSVPGLIAIVDPSFRMPEVWRNNLAGDYKLPWLGIIATAELVYSKDIYAAYQFNADFPNPIGNLKDSNDHRPYYPQNQNGTVASIYNNIHVSGAYLFTNSRPGDSWSATIGAQIPAKKGFYGSIFYTRMYSEEVSSNPGSQASSAWANVHSLNNPNENMLAPSAYFSPNRFVGTLSYRIQYAKHFATTVSLYYSGSNGGRFDWGYDYAINNSGTYNQLLYIPQNADELHWTPINVAIGPFSYQLFDTAQEKAAFNKFLSQDKYLNNHRGEYMQRNGESMPYYGTLNFKFLEDFITNIGPHHNSLQFSIDILNIGNLVNKNWGIQKTVPVAYDALLHGNTDHNKQTQVYLSTVTHIDKNGNTLLYSGAYVDPTTHTVSTTLGTAADGSVGPLGQPEQFLPTSSFVNSYTSGSAWSMQIGLRYNFW